MRVRRRVWVWVMLVIGVVSTWWYVEARSQLPAEVTAARLMVGPLEREYLLFRPKSLPADVVVPLVFAFHGGNGEAKGMLNLTRFLIGRVTHDVDSQTIWEFFRTHPRVP